VSEGHPEKYLRREKSMEYTFIAERKIYRDATQPTHQIAICVENAYSYEGSTAAKENAEGIAKEMGYTLVPSDACCEGYLTVRVPLVGVRSGWSPSFYGQ
jgi:hypothetical protein